MERSSMFVSFYYISGISMKNTIFIVLWYVQARSQQSLTS